MAVTSFDRIHNGRATQLAMGRDQLVTRYTDIFRAETDTNFTEPEDVKAVANCPRIGQAHDRDPTAFCRSINVVNEPFSKQVFLITVGFSTEFEMTEDPRNEPARIVWNTEQYQKPVIFDRNRVAHMNSARDWWDPPAMQDDNRWIAVVTKQVAVVPTWLLTYPDAVNNAIWVIDNVAVAKGFAKLSAITIGEEQERNNIVFRTLTMTFQFSDLDSTTNMLKWDESTSAYIPLGAAEFEHAHAIITPNLGLYERIGGVLQEITDTPQIPVSVPKPLDKDGKVLNLGTVDPSDVLFIVSDVYPEKDFSVLPVV